MAVETIRMSSKGQIVIPQDLRDELGVHEGTLFAVVGSKDTIILKKIATPSKEEILRNLERIAKKAKAHLQSKGFTEKDLQER